MNLNIEKILKTLLLVAIIGYLGINFAARLPAFLVAENLVYAFIYALAYIRLERTGTPGLLAAFSAFNAGRVSRSIVSPRGEIGGLALQHVPLLILILSITMLSLVLLERRRRYA